MQCWFRGDWKFGTSGRLVWYVRNACEPYTDLVTYRIDSLCIVQDSNADKERELPKMAAIFANSRLTIAGPMSAHSQQSFLVPRQSRQHYLQLGHLYLRPKPPLHEHSVHDSILAQRAWVFQEFQLAKRILCFTSAHLVWLCREEVKFEDTQGVESHQEQSRAENMGETFYGGVLKMEIKYHDRSPIVNSSWYELVEEYSRKRMSYEEDKLPAISAIAQAVMRTVGEVYEAGLWRGDLVKGLLWRRTLDEEQGGFARLEKSGAPSWSWAAYDGAVDTHDCRSEAVSEYFAVVQNVETVPMNPLYVTGRVWDGTISMSAPCTDIFFEGNCSVSTNTTSQDWLIHVPLDDGRVVTITFDLLEERAAGTPALCVAMTKSGGYRTNGEEGVVFLTRIRCLILRLDSVERGVYRRVGVGLVEEDEKKSTAIVWSRRNVMLV
jgi:hypothetical protein